MSENNTPEINGEEEERELIYLTDEEGNELPFELLDVVDYNDEQYAVFFPADESEEDEDADGEVVILKVIIQEDDSAEFVSTDDTEVLDAVFDIFLGNLRKAFDLSDDGHCCDCGDEHCCH